MPSFINYYDCPVCDDHKWWNDCEEADETDDCHNCGETDIEPYLSE